MTGIYNILPQNLQKSIKSNKKWINNDNTFKEEINHNWSGACHFMILYLFIYLNAEFYIFYDPYGDEQCKLSQAINPALYNISWCFIDFPLQINFFL